MANPVQCIRVEVVMISKSV